MSEGFKMEVYGNYEANFRWTDSDHRISDHHQPNEQRGRVNHYRTNNLLPRR